MVIQVAVDRNLPFTQRWMCVQAAERMKAHASAAYRPLACMGRHQQRAVEYLLQLFST